MSTSRPNRDTPGLQPPGHRWGRGARTVVPYLVHTLHVTTTSAEIVLDDGQPIRNPVFPGMHIRVTTQQQQ